MAKHQFTSENQPKKRRGRGPGARTKILAAMEKEGVTEEGFWQLMIQRAMNPKDSFGAAEILKRLSPTHKPTLPAVEFEFDEKAKPEVQAAQIVKAMSEGIITPDVGALFIGSVKNMKDIVEVTELQQRIEAIEEQLNG